MITVLISDYERYLKDGGSHPTECREGTNGRTCVETGEPLLIKVTGRSIWFKPFLGGRGEVRRVTHLHCGGCEPDRWKDLQCGKPIYEDELMGVE